MEHATTVPAGIWAVQSRMTQSEQMAGVHGSRAEGREGVRAGVLRIAKREAGCKIGASMTRLPGNDESSKNNQISEEE